MGFNFFGKKSADQDAGPAHRDPQKAQRFFEHAQTVADARNYDYAIECFVNGLRQDPDNMARHEELYEVAKRRKVGGGKPAAFKEKFNLTTRDPIERLLHAETLWAKDPLNPKRMIEVMDRAVQADQASEAYHFGEIAYWIGSMIVEAGQTSKPLTKNEWLKVRDLLASIDAYAEAVTACQMAIELDPEDHDLPNELKNLDAERTMHEGYTESVKGGKDSFRQVLRNAEEQKALHQEAGTTKSETALQETLARRREAFGADPEDTDAAQKLVNTLIEVGTEASEAEAMEILGQLHEKTEIYKYKNQADDLRIKQFNRRLREKQQAAEGGDEAAKEAWRKLASEKLQFELEVYRERSKTYPTDLKIKHELGKRLLAFKKYDEAIAIFQQAKNDPKQRAAACEYLGRCYLAKTWLDEAVQTLREGLEQHPARDDTRGKEMRYLLMEALEKQAEQEQSAEIAQEAQKVASELVQTDIAFRDVQERMNRLRERVKAFKASAS